MSDTPTTRRLFVAAPLPLTLKRDLELYQGSLLQNPRSLKIVKPLNFHITLHFLGNCRVDQELALQAALPDIARMQAPFEIEIGGVKAFPGAITIPVVTGRAELIALGMMARGFAETLGFISEKRAIDPHITIARMRDHAQNPGDCMQEEEAEEAFRWTLKSIVLYESVLSAEGPDYAERGRYPLG